MHLYIGYQNYSSWSLRPWLAMKVAGIGFEQTLLPFYHSSALKELAAQHEIPAAVPVLEQNGQMIWDSMAIMETLAEQFPDKKLWPENSTLRALARSVAAEMHSGFSALRSQFPMNCRVSCEVEPSEASKKDLARLSVLWRKFNQPEYQAVKESGPFLCGHFSIVDAMYAPVMWRVKGYGLAVSDEFSRWSEAMLALPAMQQWLHDAKQEAWKVEQYDAVAGLS
ncbi:glutathione S-transferase [Reinekea thalattae]|uniref:Glutathione S-transferase n=1 Tax=Reinekea thalattae TaxID=2593301 RepID=A0A5C8ZBE9_9GAMM|nr:glutathione S-transferase [Reinekea thalattae]TXR54518.1 glutathione S-transferase [Reinekea thalattae]